MSKGNVITHLLQYCPYPSAILQRNCRPASGCGASEDGDFLFHPGDRDKWAVVGNDSERGQARQEDAALFSCLCHCKKLKLNDSI